MQMIVLCPAVGDEVLVGDQTFQYFNSDNMRTLQDDSIGSTAKVNVDQRLVIVVA